MTSNTAGYDPAANRATTTVAVRYPCPWCRNTATIHGVSHGPYARLAPVVVVAVYECEHCGKDGTLILTLEPTP